MTDRTEPSAGELRELLAVVLEALDIPYPATLDGGARYGDVLADRALHVVIALEHTLEGQPPGIGWPTGYLRDRLAENPPTGYVTDDQVRAALAAGKTWTEAVTPPGGDQAEQAGTVLPFHRGRGDAR
jgi:hypothetical protein